MFQKYNSGQRSKGRVILILGFQVLIINSDSIKHEIQLKSDKPKGGKAERERGLN